MSEDTKIKLMERDVLLATARLAMLKLEPNDRLLVTQDYCYFCGEKIPCTCWRDE